ncbi:MAG TPA: hypothetical protein VJV79_38925 [Polyangiaceae bacterium]|nr:hypothetical protein [Polyangiaceae bacterium]
MKHRLWSALSILLGVLAVAGEMGVFFVLRFTNRLYASDGPWLVAEYAEPYRGSFLTLLVATSGWLAVRAARSGSASASAGLLGVLLAGLALSCELGMGLFFHPISGEFSVTAATFSRVEFRLPINETGPCFASDTHGFFRWSLAGHTFAPRLLPLPLESKQLEDALRCPWLVRVPH